MAHGLISHNGLIIPSRGPLSSPDSRAIAKEVRLGCLVKLRRGIYVDASEWNDLDARGQHILRVRAVIESASHPVVVAGFSAAALWGMPILGEWPKEVTVIDAWKGGGRSEPGVRRTTAGSTSVFPVVWKGVEVTSLARTAVDIARAVPLAEAMGSVDWALWRFNPSAVEKSDLMTEARLLSMQARRMSVIRVVDLSTHLSDSFGESQCRAVMYQLGFELPELQVRLSDMRGDMFPDYLWRSVRIFGEFDGKLKFTRNEFTGGNPGEVAWREKKREDRLRRLGLSGVRITSEDVARPRQLERLLLEAGVPRIGGR